MVFDHLNNASVYECLHPALAKAFTFLREAGVESLAPGRYDIEGDRLYANVEEGEGRGRAAAKLEAHRRYLDVQYLVTGQETIGWRPIHTCTQIDTAYDAERDFALYTDPPQSWPELLQGTFMIFWPEDAHAPASGTGSYRKVIVKVEV